MRDIFRLDAGNPVDHMTELQGSEDRLDVGQIELRLRMNGLKLADRVKDAFEVGFRIVDVPPCRRSAATSKNSPIRGAPHGLDAPAPRMKTTLLIRCPQ